MGNTMKNVILDQLLFSIKKQSYEFLIPKLIFGARDVAPQAAEALHRARIRPWFQSHILPHMCDCAAPAIPALG